MTTMSVALKSQSVSSWNNIHRKLSHSCHNLSAILDLTDREEPGTSKVKAGHLMAFTQCSILNPESGRATGHGTSVWRGGGGGVELIYVHS